MAYVAHVTGSSAARTERVHKFSPQIPIQQGHYICILSNWSLLVLTEVWILQGIYPLKDEWVFGCSLKPRLADQTKLNN